MILSHERKFVFIKGIKVAGTSIEIALAGVCGPDCIITPITPIDELSRIRRGRGAQNYSDDPASEQAYIKILTARSDLGSVNAPKGKYQNHMTLREVLTSHGDIVEDYLVLGIERCPYRKIISWANMELSFQAYKAGGEMRANVDDVKSFLEAAVENGRIAHVLNLPRYLGQDGKIGVTHMLRYENLQDDFQHLKSILGLPCDLTLPHAKKGMLSNDYAIPDIFSMAQIRRINEIFASEFEAFGYDMLAA